jgi:phosphoribosylformylglycinamidine synthase
VLASNRGLAISQAVNPTYSRIDAYHMTSVTIDEAVRRIIAVGGDPEHIGGMDNFCWPEITDDPERNPDGKLKAAHLVRSCLAMKRSCLAMGIPLLSGKDSMYIDGDLSGAYGERHRISGLPTLQFTTISVVSDVRRCVSMDPKRKGDSVYLLGVTKDELGGSEYYDLFGLTGINVPRVDPQVVFPMYKSLSAAIGEGLVASAHGVYRGGLGVHLAWMAMAGGFGIDVELARVPCGAADGSDLLRDDRILYSESAGRLLVTIAPAQIARFEELMADHVAIPIGRVADGSRLMIHGGDGETLIDLPIESLREAWKRPFGHLV